MTHIQSETCAFIYLNIFKCIFVYLNVHWIYECKTDL